MFRAMEILHKDHEAFGLLLDLIEEELETFRQADRPDYALLEAVIDYFKTYPQCVHHFAEDMVYQKLKARAPDATEKIPDLDREHRRESERLQAFARLVELVLAEEEVPRGAVIEAAEAFVQHMRRHMKMEEALFFPAAEAHLHTDDWTEIDDRLRAGHGPVIGGARPAQMQDLREELLRWCVERAEALSETT